MPKANIKLPDGTTIQIEGNLEEIQKLLDYYSSKTPQSPPTENNRARKKNTGIDNDQEASGVTLSEIINTIKDCDEAELIDQNILDKTSRVNRILLPLYIISKYHKNNIDLSTGEISKITQDLGVKISVSNVSHVLSKTAKSYVIGDKVKKKGRKVKYQLSRRGMKYMESVISGNNND